MRTQFCYKFAFFWLYEIKISSSLRIESKLEPDLLASEGNSRVFIIMYNKRNQEVEFNFTRDFYEYLKALHP